MPQRALEKRHESLPVGAGDGERGAEPQIEELRDGGLRIEPLGLVDRDPDRFPEAPQTARDVPIPSRHPRATIDDQQHHI